MAQHGGGMVKDLNGEEGALEWLQRRRPAEPGEGSWVRCHQLTGSDSRA